MTTCHNCKKEIDPYNKPVVCYAIDPHKFAQSILSMKEHIPPRMEFTCTKCSRRRSDGTVRGNEKRDHKGDQW